VNLNVSPATALKLFMFAFVGGLIGIGHQAVGGDPSLTPLVIVLAGFGAVSCVELLVRTRR
jgi:hypothetical protein